VDKSTDSEKILELQKRVQALEDREAVRECLTRYCYDVDLGRPDDYTDVFTPDGFLDIDGNRMEGRDGLLDMFAGASHHVTIMNSSTHNVTNLFIRVDGDTAWAEGYQIVIVKDRGGEQRRIHYMSYNHWTLEKGGGKWRIKGRVRREVGGREWGGKVMRQYLDAK